MLYNNYRDLINKRIAWFIPIKSLRDKFRNILDDIVNTMYKIEYLVDKNNTLENKDKRLFIIWQCDGFAGQIWKYILGESIKQNQNNIRIKYDISWHINNGKDAYGKDKRVFDLVNCFPDLNIEVAEKEELEIHRRLFTYRGPYNYDIENIVFTKKNAYLDGYPKLLKHDINIIKEKLDLDKHLFHRLKDENLNVYNMIVNHEASVTVHIRRGDINLHGEYAFFNNSDKVYKEYIIKAINKMIDKLKPITPKFFFISNDMNWVKNNILNNFNNSIDYYEVKGNDDQVYFDLYLLSKGKNMILTIGGFSHFGKFFNKNENPIIISPDNIDSI